MGPWAERRRQEVGGRWLTVLQGMASGARGLLSPLAQRLSSSFRSKDVATVAEFVLSLNTSTIRPAPLLRKIEVAAQAGFQAIELWNDEMTQYVENGGRLSDIAQALRDHGLTVPTVIHLGGWMDAEGETYRKVLDEARRKMEQAAQVGARRIIAGPAREPVDLGRAAERYRELLEIGRGFGVLPAVEFLGFVNGVHTIRAAWEIVQRADDPDGTIVLDPFHIFRGGSPVEDLELIPADRIAVFHFNDAPGSKPRQEQGDADRVMPGDGILPLVEELRILARKGYRGAVSLELFNRALWERDPLTVAREGIAKMRAIIDQV